MPRRASVDWREVAKRYIEGGEALRPLAVAVNLPYASVQRHAVAEGWVAKREAFRRKALGKFGPPALPADDPPEVEVELDAFGGSVEEPARLVEDVRRLRAKLAENLAARLA